MWSSGSSSESENEETVQMKQFQVDIVALLFHPTSSNQSINKNAMQKAFSSYNFK